MENKKLERSVVTPEPRSSRAWMVALAILTVSLPANLVLWLTYRDAQESNAFWAEAARGEQKKNDDLVRKNDGLRSDIDQMTSTIPPGGISSREGEVVYHDCIRQPIGLQFSPYLLTKPGESYYVEFRVHNTGVLTNREGERYSLGSPCDVEPGARLKILAVTPLDYVLGLDGQQEDRPTSCPAGAYHLVDRQDAVVETAIAYTCLAKAKASELDPNLR